MRENYEDFERLMGAKNGEMRALIDAQEGDKAANENSAGIDQNDLQTALNWIEHNGPTIN